MSLYCLGHGETGLMQPGSRDRSVGKVRWRMAFLQAGAERRSRSERKVQGREGVRRKKKYGKEKGRKERKMKERTVHIN
jgi:hypothetical protein